MTVCVLLLRSVFQASLLYKTAGDDTF